MFPVHAGKKKRSEEREKLDEELLIELNQPFEFVPPEYVCFLILSVLQTLCHFSAGKSTGDEVLMVSKEATNNIKQVNVGSHNIAQIPMEELNALHHRINYWLKISRL